MEDTGWYRANYTQGGMSPWGLGAGCDFVNKPCLTTDSSGDVTVPEYSKGYFCTDQGKRGCSPALTHKLACTVVDDFCPLFGSTFAGLDPEQLACDDTKNADSLNIYR
jgi:hypothetical protein